MKVFFSWSGERSKAVAEALGPWLRQVIQAIDPWASTEIRKGSRWGPEIATALEQTKVGIICLTRENLTEPWILFEAGALSKTKDAVVCTFLLDLGKADVEQPLAQFQHTTSAEEDVRELVHSLNTLVRAAGERALSDSDLEDVFELFWPRLKTQLQAIPATPAVPLAPVRSDSDILREILDTVRQNSPRQPLGPAVLPVSSLSEDDDGPYTYQISLPKSPNDKGKARVIGTTLSGLPKVRTITANTREDGGFDIQVHCSEPSSRLIRGVLDGLKVRAPVKRTKKPDS